MANWLQKILLPAPPAPKNRNLPMNVPTGQLPVMPRAAAPQDQLPIASVIYGMAASGLFVLALYFLLTGLWFTGLLVLLPAGCFLGFALFFIKAR